MRKITFVAYSDIHTPVTACEALLGNIKELLLIHLDMYRKSEKGKIALREFKEDLDRIVIEPN